MNVIRPLLQVTPSEVPVNFMTDFIRRFVESPKDETADSFDRFLGRTGLRARILSIGDPRNSRRRAVPLYTRDVQCPGGYHHGCAAIVICPQVERCFFHLAYATRDTDGVEVFMRVEREAMAETSETRAVARIWRRSTADRPAAPIRSGADAPGPPPGSPSAALPGSVATSGRSPATERLPGRVRPTVVGRHELAAGLGR